MLRRLGSALGGSKGRASSGQQEQQQQPPSPSAASSSSPSPSNQKQHHQQQPQRPAHAMMAQRQPPSSAAASLLPRVPPSLGNRTSLASGGVPRLAYVYSVPLIHRVGDEVTEPDVLDTAQELQSLQKTLRESGRKLLFRAEVATVRNFRFLVTLGCRMLHYTGHGSPSCLIFENENGEANLLSVDMLSDLFRAGGEVRTRLVFVSACHSESAGHSFAAAGVPHVVAVKYDEKVTDYAARVFAEQFYLSIVTGNTVRNAFRIGVTSIRAESSAAQDDEKKFLLLPEDGNHDVAIFDPATSGLQLGEFVDETPRPIKNTVPKPPVFFLGRNAKVQEVVALLYPPQRYRCVTVRGEPGIGKTAVALRACEYMAERRMFDAIHHVPLHETHFRVTDKGPLCETLGAALEIGGARNARDLLRALQGGTATHPGDPARRVLLLLDGLDRFLTQGSVLIPTLSFLLGKHQGLHLLITAEGSLNANGDGLLENTPEKVVELGPLSDVNAAHLLVYVAPRRLRFEEMAASASSQQQPPTKPPPPSSTTAALAAVGGTGATAPTAASASVLTAAAKGEALGQLASSPVLRALHGHPKAILTFAPLLEGHRLDGLGEGARRCYREATRRFNPSPSASSAAFLGGSAAASASALQSLSLSGSHAGLVGGGGGDGHGAGGMEAVEIKDPAAARLWAELTSATGSTMGGSGSSLNGQGSSSSSSSPSLSGGAARPSLSKRHGAGSSSSSFLSLGGVPWYRVTAAVQHQLKLTLHEALTTSTAIATATSSSGGPGGVERPKSTPLPPKPPMLGPASLSTAPHIAAASTGGAALAEGEPPSLLEAVTGGGSGAGAGGKRPSQQQQQQGSGSSSSALSSFLDKGTTPPHPPSLLATATGTRAGVGFSTATGGGGGSGSSLGPSPSLRRRHSSYTPPDGRRPQRLSRAASSSLSAAAAAALEGIRGLSDDDLLFLKGKLLPTAAAAQQPAGSDMVTARDFEAFALWWAPVATALRLLAPLWCHQHPHPLLHGFQSRRGAEALLQGTKPGTFLVRFSTSHLGLLAVSFVVAGGATGASAEGEAPAAGGGGVVQHCLVRVTPQGCDLFVETGRKRYETFADLIRDCATLLCFYPDTPKEDALHLLLKPVAAASSMAPRAAPLPRHEEGDEGVATTPSTNGNGNGNAHA